MTRAFFIPLTRPGKAPHCLKLAGRFAAHKKRLLIAVADGIGSTRNGDAAVKITVLVPPADQSGKRIRRHRKELTVLPRNGLIRGKSRQGIFCFFRSHDSPEVIKLPAGRTPGTSGRWEHCRKRPHSEC